MAPALRSCVRGLTAVLVVLPLLASAQHELAVAHNNALAIMPGSSLAIRSPEKCLQEAPHRAMYETREEVATETTTFISFEQGMPIMIAFPEVLRSILTFSYPVGFLRGFNLRDDAPEIGWTSVTPVSRGLTQNRRLLTTMP